MARAIVIEFLGDAKQLNRTADQVTGKTSSLGDKMKRVGTIAAAGFAIAGAAAVKFGGDAIRNASDLNETLSKSEAIFGKQAPAMEKWAGAAARTAGLSKEAALGAAAGFGDMFTQIGFAGGAAAKMSKEVVQASADLGSFNNLDTADVADRMSAAFRGEYDSLQAVIPNINAARVESEALAATGKKTADSLTAQEKAAAVLAIVQKDGARAMGDFERTSGGLANQQKILKAQLENVSAEVGQKLLPVAVKLATWANDKMVPAARELATWFGDKVVPAFGKVRAVVERVFGGMAGDVAGPLGDVKGIIRDTISIVRSLWARFGGTILKYTSSTFKNVKTVIGGALKIVSGIFKVFSSLLKGDWKGAWDGVKKILSGALDVIKGAIKQAINVVRTVWRIGWSALKGITGAVFDGIKSLARNGLDWLINQIKAIPGRIRGLVGSFGSAGRAIITAFVNGLKNAGGVISGIAGNVWGALKGLLNGAIDKINRALEFSIKVGPKSFSINPPDIPRLYARGTNFHTGGRAIVGEEGPELLDLPVGSRVRTAGETRRMLGGGGSVATSPTIIINVNGALDPTAVARQLESILAKHVRHTGRPIQVRTLGPA